MTMNRGRLRKWQWMSALWLLLLASSLPAANTEADVKAAFIYNFTKFVEWPLTALADNTPLQLCILGQDDTSNRLRQLHGREAQGRSLQIRQLTAPNEAAGCHVLFITRHASRQLKEITHYFPAAPLVSPSVTPLDSFSKAARLSCLSRPIGCNSWLMSTPLSWPT
jgi:hypothetical protein